MNIKDTIFGFVIGCWLVDWLYIRLRMLKRSKTANLQPGQLVGGIPSNNAILEMLKSKPATKDKLVKPLSTLKGLGRPGVKK